MSDPVTTELLDDVVRRIVEIAHPRRIILFGSADRGQNARWQKTAKWQLGNVE